eukprot:9130053-Alexandrium_andersonii.AAC.1
MQVGDPSAVKHVASQCRVAVGHPEWRTSESATTGHTNVWGAWRAKPHCASVIEALVVARHWAPWGRKARQR